MAAVSVHFLDRTPAVGVTALAALTVAAGTGNLIGDWRPWREPRFPLALPVLAVFSVAGIARLAGPAFWLVAILPIGWLFVAWVVDLELFGFFRPHPSDLTEEQAPKPVRRITARRRPESELLQIVVEDTISEPEVPPHPRSLAIRSTALALAFLGFVAVGGFVAGALGDAGQKLQGREMAELVAVNAVVAGLVGYRISALVASSARDRMIRILAVLEYAVPVAAASWALRALTMPRLFAPALLTLLVYVITVLRESSEPVLMNIRLLRELAALTLVAVIAIAWGLMAR